MHVQRSIRVLVIGLITCPIAWSTVAMPSATQILMENGSPYYIPATAIASSGTPIRWDNPTPTHHTVTHNDCVKDEGPCLFDSGAVAPGGHFIVSDLPPGRYPYQCRIHPIMRGLLTVTDNPAVPSPL